MNSQKENADGLSRRERQIMEVLFQKGRASAADVREGIPNPPSYSAVRALLAVLEQKGRIRHVEEDGRYIYLPKETRQKAARSALKRVLEVFYGGCVESAVAALLDVSEKDLTLQERKRVQKLIALSKEQGK